MNKIWQAWQQPLEGLILKSSRAPGTKLLYFNSVCFWDVFLSKRKMGSVLSHTESVSHLEPRHRDFLTPFPPPHSSCLQHHTWDHVYFVFEGGYFQLRNKQSPEELCSTGGPQNTSNIWLQDTHHKPTHKVDNWTSEKSLTCLHPPGRTSIAAPHSLPGSWFPQYRQPSPFWVWALLSLAKKYAWKGKGNECMSLQNHQHLSNGPRMSGFKFWGFIF